MHPIPGHSPYKIAALFFCFLILLFFFIDFSSKTDNPAPKEETQVSTKQKKAPLPIFYAITSPANAYK